MSDLSYDTTLKYKTNLIKWKKIISLTTRKHKNNDFFFFLNFS